MELSKSFQVCSDYKDRSSGPSWEMLQFAEVLFVDKINPSNKPLLYQLSNSKLHLREILHFYKSIPLNFSHDAFILVGEVLFIDKKKKQVSLANNQIVSYNHIVIASGKKIPLCLQGDELVAALQALTDALRFMPKITDSFPLQKSSLQKAQKMQNAAKIEEQHIQKGMHPHILEQRPQNKSPNLDAYNNRFYEVQI